jgi:glycosyltransferase involved in cell wall biosynthesis
MNRRLLIWGEFPPQTQTGVSISNQLVADVLSEEGFSVKRFREHSWEKGGLTKVFYYLGFSGKLIFHAVFHHYDILYTPIPLSLQGLIKLLVVLPWLKLSNWRANFSGHIHRGDFREFIEKGWLHGILIKFTFLFFHRIIALSERFKKEIVEVFPDTSTLVLPNTSTLEGTARNKRYYDPPRFICVSNYIKSKGIEELVEAFDHNDLKDIHLDMYGHSYERAFVKQLKNSVHPNIQLKGPISRSDMHVVLNDYDGLILPSWNEGQPIIILEAMSLGLPVVATSVGDISDMLGEEYPFLVQPQNVAELRNAIIGFKAFSKKEQLGKRLYQRYLERYSNQHYRERLVNIFTI